MFAFARAPALSYGEVLKKCFFMFFLLKGVDKYLSILYNIDTVKEREVIKMTTIITTTLFWQFVILNFVNVLINTARSLTTVKGGKWIASLMNALCY